MGLFDDVLTASSPAVAEPPQRRGLFDDVLQGVRSFAAASLNLPAAADQAVKGEVVRLGRAAADVPSFQSVAPQLGEIVRQPLNALGLPTGVTAGFAPGTKLGQVARGIEQQGQNVALAGLADTGVMLGAEGLIGRVPGLVKGLRGTTPVRQAEEALQARRPITVAEAERIVRTGHPPPGFAKRVSQLSQAQRQELAQRLGQVETSTPVVPESPRALPAPKVPVYELSKEEFHNLPLIKYIEHRPKGLSVQERNLLGQQLVDSDLMSIDDFNAMTGQFGFDPEVIGQQNLSTQKPLPSAPIEGEMGQALKHIAQSQIFNNIPLFAHKKAIAIALAEGKSIPKRVIDSYKGHGWITSEGYTTNDKGIPITLEEAVKSYGGHLNSQQIRASSEQQNLEVKTLPALTQPLVRVRQQAIGAVLRDLREQSAMFGKAHQDLRRRVLEAGGIRPTVGGQLREELQAIRPFLRKEGQAIDDLATELGYENGEALREALIAGHGAKMPKLVELRQQAVQIVDSQAGQRILQALQGQQASGQAIRSVVRDVTHQMQQELKQGARQASAIAQAGQRQALTPTQVGRFIRQQRVEPGQLTTGPRGGVKEAPLTPGDVRRVIATAQGIVPRPGQPTGTPPILPRSQSLIPAEAPRPIRDLNEFQATPMSGLDPSRAAQVIDGKRLGPTERAVLQPLRQGEIVMRREHGARIQQLRQVSKNMKAGSPESRQVFLMLENRLPAGTQVSQRMKDTASWMAGQFDQLLAQVNEARVRIGKQPILRRKDYITHITEPDFWAEMRGAFTNLPDDATQTMADRFFEMLRARTPGFKFGLPRQRGPFAEDAVRAFEAYVPAAERVIHLSEPTRLATVYINRSLAGVPNAHRYFTQLVNQVATGQAGPVARITPKTILRINNWVKSRFAKGTILGNTSSVLQQVYTLPATVSATTERSATTAALWMTRGDGLSFARQWSTQLQARATEVDVEIHSLYGRVEQALAAPFGAADRTMVAHAFLSGYVQGTRQGMAFRQAIEFGDSIAQRTQASFLTTDLPPVFRDSIMASALQFQNTVNGVFNFMKFDIPQSGRAWRAALSFAGTFMGLAAIYDYLGLPHPDRITEFIPGLSTIRSGGGPVSFRLLQAFGNLASGDPRKRAEGLRSLEVAATALIVGPGGNQLRKIYQGTQAVRRGGKFDKGGRLQFRVRGLPEQTRAVLFGPYQTKAGQQYLQQRQQPKQKRQVSLIDAALSVPATTNGGQRRSGGLFDDVLSK